MATRWGAWGELRGTLPPRCGKFLLERFQLTRQYRVYRHVNLRFIPWSANQRPRPEALRAFATIIVAGYSSELVARLNASRAA